MEFSEIKEKMNESKIIKYFVYIDAVLIIGLSIIVPIWFHLKAPKIFSIPIAIIFGLFILFIGAFEFLFNANYSVFKSFLNGYKPGIIFAIVLIIIAWIFYFITIILNKNYYRYEFYIATIFAIYVVIMYSLRLRELK